MSSGKIEFSLSPTSSPRSSPRIRPSHRANVASALHNKFHRHGGRRTTESSPDINSVTTVADSTYGGSTLADLDIGPSQADSGHVNLPSGMKSSSSFTGSKPVKGTSGILPMPPSRQGSTGDSTAAMTAFYEQVRSWYENQLEVLSSATPSGPSTPSAAAAIASTPVSLGLDSLKQLETILESVAPLQRPSFHRRRSSKSLKPNQRHSYGVNLEDFYTTDHEKTILQDVPSCEAELDNSREHSAEFKSEVLRLAHTLKIKNWRKVDLERGGELGVTRISGALTNAVYKVTPPEVSVEKASKVVDTPYMSPADKPEKEKRPRQPKPLLLRIYGPQVGHLIDRDTELNILRRLAKHKVGPTLLGTFDNGRFEEFFDARTLTREDIRYPDTSRSIGRRLRDLHDHIPLLNSEREAGAGLWKNWNKWVSRGSSIMKVLERQEGCAETNKWLLVTSWEKVRTVVEVRYKEWLENKYGGDAGIKKKLIFCHNDTQYGNIMSRETETEPPTPASKSPGLKPILCSNVFPTKQDSTPSQKKNLIVIDFEYAGANTRGCEFANHFSEWMSDYHSLLSPHAYFIHEDLFPSIEEQKNILRSYVEHRPLPYINPTEDSNDPEYLRQRQSMIFSLDRLPTKDEEEVIDKEVERLVQESMNWRPLVNICWCLWGVVQANIPGLVLDGEGDEGVADVSESAGASAEEKKEGSEAGEEAEEFDYIKYAEQKVMCFWGDMIGLGIVSEDELKEWSGIADIKPALKWLPIKPD